MEISKTLFVVNPDDKFLCSYHGGLMDIPFENSTCLHCFCSFCIETLPHCPIDNMPITNISVNEQLKDEFDQLLCYCKFGIGVNELNGEVTTKVNGCNCLISYGSKEAHESICKFNENKSPSFEFNDFYEMKFSSDGLSSIGFSSPSNNGSPKSNNSSSSSSKSPSFEQISLQQKQQQQIKQNSPIQLSTSPNNNNNNHNINNQVEEYFDKNALWESSTSLFFCNRYCPNKEFGCCYSGKTEQDINYHLEVECFCQKMKEKIIELESKVEEKEMEIISLKKSTSMILTNEKPSNNKIVGKTTPSPLSLSSSSSSIQYPQSSSSSPQSYKYNETYTHSASSSNKQIQTFTISKIFIIFFDILRKGIKKSFKKVKKFFKRKNSNSPYKNFIKLNN